MNNLRCLGMRTWYNQFGHHFIRPQVCQVGLGATTFEPKDPNCCSIDIEDTFHGSKGQFSEGTWDAIDRNFTRGALSAHETGASVVPSEACCRSHADGLIKSPIFSIQRRMMGETTTSVPSYGKQTEGTARQTSGASNNNHLRNTSDATSNNRVTQEGTRVSRGTSSADTAGRVSQPPDKLPLVACTKSKSLGFGIDRILSIESKGKATSVPRQSVPMMFHCDFHPSRLPCFCHHTTASSLPLPNRFRPQIITPKFVSRNNSFQTSLFSPPFPSVDLHLSSSKRKRSWSRTVFSSLQRKGLERRFKVQKYVSKPDRRQLAAMLGLTDAQVKVWFQNRRMKWRHSQEYKNDNDDDSERKE